MSIELRLEPWNMIWPEAKPLMARHHEEVHERDSRMPFKPALQVAQALQEAGVLKIVTARSAGQLVGYCIWYLSPDLESEDVLVASQGPWYVLPEWRASGVGIRLVRESVRHLRDAGASLILLHHWANNPRLGMVFGRLGAKPLETVYELWV